MTLRVAQFVLKIAHLAISMEPRGPPTLIMVPVRIVLFLYAGGQIELRSKVFGMLCFIFNHYKFKLIFNHYKFKLS